jgi:putative membrane protein
MLTDDTTDKYIDKVVKRYSKLFGLPSQRKLLIYLGLLSLHGGLLAILPLSISLDNFVFGLSFGILFLILTLIADFIISHWPMKNDLIFNYRRCSALSFFSSLIFFGILILGAFLSTFLGIPNLWIKFFFLSISGALILRLLVFSITSFVDIRATFFSSLLRPILILILVLLPNSTIPYEINLQFLTYITISLSVPILTVLFFKYFMDTIGKKTIGISSSILFKAFLANWTEDLNSPLENFFEQLGNKQDIRVSFLTFSTKDRIKATIIVPALHPGPFKNLGSSLLPYLIQTEVQNKFDCVVSVPHGLVGHELDVSSQSENQRVVNNILNFIVPSKCDSKATPLVRTEIDDSKASCQIFGNCAFITLTTAPKTMEDLPPQLDSFIVNEAKKCGFFALAIDAHNSMDDSFDQDAVVESFRKASVDCLKKALGLNFSSFSVGAASIRPSNFSVGDGMGAGGISVIVVNIAGQNIGYVTIDGNNMVSGLREKILAAIKELGIDDGEVFTTDTHSVCGMIRSRRGYNLVGEAINTTELIRYIKEATSLALDNIETVEASFQTEVIPDVKIIGEKQINELTILADKTTERVKKLAITLFPLASIFLIFFLFFLI